jgi:hypothetical protein
VTPDFLEPEGGFVETKTPLEVEDVDVVVGESEFHAASFGLLSAGAA